jgi:hypothetical protein
VADYIGSRRVVDPSKGAEQAQRAFAEDDAVPTCPKCGAAVRLTQDWCSLCLHVLRTPEPAAPAPQPAAVGEEPDGSTASEAEHRIDVEAAAEALLSQLAAETKRDGLHIPSFLSSKARIGVFVAAAMSALCGGLLLAMSVLGWLFG